MLLQRRASSVASPSGNQGLLRSPRHSIDGGERDRRPSSVRDLQRGDLKMGDLRAESSPTMTDATGLVTSSCASVLQPCQRAVHIACSAVLHCALARR